MKHKDGLTAKCPHFTTRTSYRREHWIACGCGLTMFKGRADRDGYYRRLCCTRPEECALNKWRNKP